MGDDCVSILFRADRLSLAGGGAGKGSKVCRRAVVWDNTPAPSPDWAYAQTTLERPSSPRSTRASESLPEQLHHRLLDEWLTAPLWPPPCCSKRLHSRPRAARASLDSILFATGAPSIGFDGSTAGQSDPPMRQDRLRSVPRPRGGARRPAGLGAMAAGVKVD